ncbi:MAG TPA: hypothetical protein PKB13_09345 [Clostridia bacterium]|nr:hypothetical protein [Clostridia bacterium]
MKKATAKHLCLFIAALMALSLFPISSLAISAYVFKNNGAGLGHSSLQSAIDAVPEGGSSTITIEKYSESSPELPSNLTERYGLRIVNKQITLALGSCNLTVINEDTELPPEDVMYGKGCLISAEEGHTSSLSFVGPGSFSAEGMYYGMFVSAQGNGAIATVTSNCTVTGGEYGLQVESNDGGTANVTVGSTIVSGSSGYAATVLGSGSTLTVNGPLTAQGESGTGFGISGGTAVINGNITGNNCGLRTESGNVTVNGNILNFLDPDSKDTACGIDAGPNSSITVNGNISTNGVGVLANGDPQYGAATVTINGNITSSSTEQPAIRANQRCLVTVIGSVSGVIGAYTWSQSRVVINGKLSGTEIYILLYVPSLEGGDDVSRAEGDFDMEEDGYYKYIGYSDETVEPAEVWVKVPVAAPEQDVYTYPASTVSGTGAALSGGVSGIPTVSIGQRGFLLSTTTSPDFNTAGVLDVKAGEDFKASATGLKASTLYYVRAYARTNEGTVYYGNTVSFTTGAPNVPNTGDETVLGAAFVLLLAATLAGAYAVVRRKPSSSKAR